MNGRAQHSPASVEVMRAGADRDPGASTGPLVVHLAAAPEFHGLIAIHEVAHLSGFSHVFVASPGTDLDAISARGYGVVAIPLRRQLAPIADFVSLWRVLMLLRRLRPRLLHTYTPKAGLIGQLAALLARVDGRLHACRGLLYAPSMPRWLRAVVTITDWITCHIARRTMFVSDADRLTLVEAGLCPPDRARFVGSGIDLSKFRHREHHEPMREAQRASWGVRPDSVVALTVARFVEAKGYVELARAAARLASLEPTLRWVWVAPVFGDEGPVLDDRLLERLGLVGRVIRVGRCEDMPAVYAAADLLVHPSHREGVPRVLIEAAAVGLPVVASDIAGNRAAVGAGNSWLFPVGDVDRLASAVRNALADPAGRATRASRARDHVRREFDVALVGSRIKQVYEELGVHPDGRTPQADGAT